VKFANDKVASLQLEKTELNTRINSLRETIEVRAWGQGRGCRL
jgi:hypothetical protein